jgi:hypothetical protein
MSIVMLSKQLPMHMITLREFMVGLRTVSCDKLSRKLIVIVGRAAAKLEPAKDYKDLTVSPR